EQICILIRRAHERGVRIILNAAPAFDLPADVLKMVSILIVNEIEIQQISKALGLPVATPQEMATALAAAGGNTCIVTMAEHGSYVAQDKATPFSISALKLETVVDT